MIYLITFVHRNHTFTYDEIRIVRKSRYETLGEIIERGSNNKEFIVLQQYKYLLNLRFHFKNR